MAKQGQEAENGVISEGLGAGSPAHREKPTAKMLFNDISKFVGRRVILSVYGGEQIAGTILGHDEVANCILETGRERKALVLGKSIVAIADTSDRYREKTNRTASK